MKKIILFFVLISFVACQDDEDQFRNALWEGANGVIIPDTIAKTLTFDPNNYDIIIRNSISYPNYPTGDSTQTRVVVAGYFKKGNSFSKIDEFSVNSENVEYYRQLFYPSYFYNPQSQFSFYNNNINLQMNIEGETYNYNYKINDILESVVPSSSSLSDDLSFSYDKIWDVYSLHAYFAFYKPLSEELYFSMNKTYEKITPDELIIDKSVIEDITRNQLGINLEFLNRVSFSFIASDTSEVMIGDKKALIYNSAEKIYNFNYNQF